MEAKLRPLDAERAAGDERTSLSGVQNSLASQKMETMSMKPHGMNVKARKSTRLYTRLITRRYTVIHGIYPVSLLCYAVDRLTNWVQRAWFPAGLFQAGSESVGEPYGESLCPR